MDFCKKYEHPYLSTDSLILFIDKLKEKKQKDDQQNQARQAVQLYYSGINTQTSTIESTHQIRESEKIIKLNFVFFKIKMNTLIHYNQIIISTLVFCVQSNLEVYCPIELV